MTRLRDYFQEVRELGARGTAFRLRWEIGRRLPRRRRTAPSPRLYSRLPDTFLARLPFTSPALVEEVMRGSLGEDALDRLISVASQSLHGRILAFSRWSADFGNPVDWYRNPVNGKRWTPQLPWQVGEREKPSPGDVKLTWEIGRFPHAYHLGRAAAFRPKQARLFADGLRSQMLAFREAAPIGFGIHWSSGQEIAFRLFAWLFAAKALFSDDEEMLLFIASELAAAAEFVETHIDYARFAVYNNHLISEALLLYIAGLLLPDAPRANRWGRFGRTLIDEACRRQFYSDGGYIQQSHNYHRVALQDLLLCDAFTAAAGEPRMGAVHEALDRSLTFLAALQNPADGRLPNYGANDGALPLILSTCRYGDFRPTLQAASLVARGERLYLPGPWDEESAWLVERSATTEPAREVHLSSQSFTTTGHHVLRGKDQTSFAVLRCGTVRDRFSQIDMLHLDVWWRGLNLFADGGSYLYNGPPEWHNHFVRTASHNTVTVNGADQMVHHRKFKTLYWTRAALLDFEDHELWARAAGEHYGYMRLPVRAVHRRSVLFLKDDAWVVVDHVSGKGFADDVRLQWLGGDADEYRQHEGELRLLTGAGEFRLAIFDAAGTPLATEVVKGQVAPPRGWISRHYGEVMAAPSLSATVHGELPVTMVSLLSASGVTVTVGETWRIDTQHCRASFGIVDGRFVDLQVAP